LSPLSSGFIQINKYIYSLDLMGIWGLSMTLGARVIAIPSFPNPIPQFLVILPYPLWLSRLHTYYMKKSDSVK
jgi:hypothetical protein